MIDADFTNQADNDLFQRHTFLSRQRPGNDVDTFTPGMSSFNLPSYRLH
jgi:hypothetical protein